MMITKMISTMTLVAIVIGVGLTPAFADSDTEIFTAVYGVPKDTKHIGPQYEEDCAGLTDKCGAQLIVRNTSFDFIYNYYKIGGAGVMCDITFVTAIDDVIIRDITFEKHETFGQWEYTVIYLPDGIDPTSSVETTTSFDNCYVESSRNYYSYW